MPGLVWIHGVGQIAFPEAAEGAVADLPVGAGVVVAGTDEATAVVIVNRDLVGFADEPSQEVAGFAGLVTEVRGHARRCGRADWVSADFDEYFLAGGRAADGWRACDRRIDAAGECPPPCLGGATAYSQVGSELPEYALDETPVPGDCSWQLDWDGHVCVSGFLRHVSTVKARRPIR